MNSQSKEGSEGELRAKMRLLHRRRFIYLFILLSGPDDEAGGLSLSLAFSFRARSVYSVEWRFGERWKGSLPHGPSF